jgi:hypothetical protein
MNLTVIKNAVQYRFNTFLDIKCRRRENVYARAIYYKLAKEFTIEPLHKIGKEVKRNHATVVNGLKVFDNIIDNFWEKEYFNIYLDIKTHIKNKISLEMKRKDPDNYYKNKYRVKLLQNKLLYNFNKDCLKLLEQMENKYVDHLRKKLNSIVNDKDKRYRNKRES